MNILFLTENFPPERNAIATRVHERACYWVQWGHKITVLTTCPNFPEGKVFPGYKNKWYQEEIIDGIRVIRVKSYITFNKGTAKRILDFLSFMISAVICGIFLKKSDYVIATSPQFFTAVAGWALGKLKRTPFIFEVADLWPESIRTLGEMRDSIFIKWMEKLELYLYRESKCVVVLTNSFKKDLIKRGIKENKIEVIINGVDLPRYKPQRKNQKLLKSLNLTNKFVVGYIGTLGISHALENVIYSAEKMKNDSKVSFLFVGPGAARDNLMELTRKKQLNNIVFVSAQPKELMPDYLSLCDIALISLKNISTFKGVIPSKIFEAMGMGLPLLLVAPKGEASKIVEKEEAGVWVPPENPVALSDAILLLKKDKEKLRKLAVHSHKASSNYSRKNQAKNMLAVLECIIE